MNLKRKITLLGLSAAFCFNPLIAGENFNAFKEELGISSQTVLEDRTCHLYIVHHGDTDYTVEKRLQGWIDIPLNEEGRKQMEIIAEQFSGMQIDAIYSSSLSRATESAEIIAKGRPVTVMQELKGESHGNLEGKKRAEYEQDPHFKQYKQLSAEEVIFFSVGEGGESKADVARRAIPAIKEICRKHPGQTVVIVTHGGVLKFLNFLLGNYSPEEIDEVPHGDLLKIDGDGVNLQVVK